jgi:hypothetical protein
MRSLAITLVLQMIISLSGDLRAVDIPSVEPVPTNNQPDARQPLSDGESDQVINLQRIKQWMGQFENSEEGKVPESLCIQIRMSGYLPSGHKGASNPREMYEFTPAEVRRLCLRAAGVGKDGNIDYQMDKNRDHVYEVVDRKKYTKIDDVCRILLALNFLEMAGRDERPVGENHHYLQVLSDFGLPRLGGASIKVSSQEFSVHTCEACVGLFHLSSATSIRFSALYHTLRRLARSELGLSGNDWRDALDYVDVDGTVKRHNENKR